mmetsp:Transcript_61257/g.149949  ORF Transcript_61257/g.149949 Transcript_61257/m.149949 type:complete len:512 (+) Transcript_61257:185-1720(+)
MTHDSSSSSSSTSTLVSNLAGIGLFLTTTLLSQWFLESVVQKGRRRRRDYDESDGGDDNGFTDGDNMEELRRLYTSRRLHDRLSYEDLSKIVTTDSLKNGQQQQQNDNVLTSTQSPSVDRHLEQHPRNPRFFNGHNLSKTAQLQSQAQVPHQKHQKQENHEALGSSPQMLSRSLGFPDHHSARQKNGVDDASNLGIDNVRTSTQVSIESNRTSSREATTNTAIATTTTKKELTEWQLHVQQRRSTSTSHLNRLHDSSKKQLHFMSTMATTAGSKTATNIDSSSSSVTTTAEFQHPNAHFDFHPKNRNWRHFEHYNEHDYRHQQQRQKSMNVKDGETDKKKKKKNSSSTKYNIDLYPSHLQSSIDEQNGWIYEKLSNGVYRCGFGTTQKAINNASQDVLEGLERCEAILSKQAFMCSDDTLTESDVMLLPTMLRYDGVYSPLFKAGGTHIRLECDYPSIFAWLQRCWNDVPGVSKSIDLTDACHSYYKQLFPLNPSGILPAPITPKALRLEK